MRARECSYTPLCTLLWGMHSVAQSGSAKNELYLRAVNLFASCKCNNVDNIWYISLGFYVFASYLLANHENVLQIYKYLQGVRKVTNICKKKKKSIVKYSIFREYSQVPRYLRVFFSAETFVSIICEFRKNAFVPYDSPGAVRSRSSPRHTYLRRVWFLWGSGKALWRYCGANGALLRRMYLQMWTLF